MTDAYCYMRRCDALASTTCRICSLPACHEHLISSSVGPVCTRCMVRLTEQVPGAPAIHPTPSLSYGTAIMYDPGTSAREILRQLARTVNIYCKRSVENACLVADALLAADEAADPVLRKDRTSTEKVLISQLCSALTVLAKPGIVFAENPDLSHYFGFLEEDPHDR